jgi:two-component sensor histidine kinase
LRTIALVHSQLFKNEAEKEINLKTYIHEIAAHLQNLFSTQDKPLQITPEVIDYNINAEDAMRIGLIVNELVTNSVKHANNLGSITQLKVKTTITPEGILKLEYLENGNPINGTLLDPNINPNVQSLGLKLIDLLKQQLGDQYIIVC